MVEESRHEVISSCKISVYRILPSFWKKKAFPFNNPACFLSGASNRVKSRTEMLFQPLGARVTVVIQVFLCTDVVGGTILKDCRSFRDRQTRFRQTRFCCFASLALFTLSKKINIYWSSNLSTAFKDHPYFIACSVLLLPLVCTSGELVLWVSHNARCKFPTMNARHSSKCSQQLFSLLPDCHVLSPCWFVCTKIH